MVAKLKMLVLGLIAVTALGAFTAAGAAAKVAKPVVILKSKGVAVPNGTEVEGGWAVAIETSEMPDMALSCEVEGSMKLATNSAAKDFATGTVGIPTEECEEFEIEEEAAAGIALFSRHSRHRAIARRKARLRSATPVVAPTLEDVTFTGGELQSEEVTTKKTATLVLSKALEVTGTEAGKSCKYVSKTKLKGEWPAVEYPGTADIESEIAFKLAKGSTKGCVKEEEGYIEAWLGPDYEELEAELT